MIDLGDRHFEVIHKPGHFIVCIASWETVTGTLFSGNIANDGSLTENTYHSNAQDYCRSMVRLYGLLVRVIHGGHFPCNDGKCHRRILRDWLDAREVT